MSTFYRMQMSIVTKMTKASESTHLLNDDRSNECIGLHIPHADVSVLAARVQDILSRDEGENGTMSALDGTEEIEPVG